MSSGHDNHPNEPKTVAFRTPMILALVTVLAIVLLVSTCDTKKCCEDGTKCEETSGGHDEHGNAATEEHMEKHDEAAAMHATEEVAPMVDSLAVKADSAAVKVEEHAAHH